MIYKDCEIISNGEIAQGIYEIRFKNRSIAEAAEPGQFVHIKIGKGLDPLLRRPISICKVDASKGIVSLVYQVIGKGTKVLAEYMPGEALDVMGPLGKGFPVLEKGKSAVIGGGIGNAPLLELASRLQNCDAYLGFRGQGYKLEEFKAYCSEVHLSSDDGSVGTKGFVTGLFESLKQYDAVYTCGPKPMMRRVKEICQRDGIKCYISVEERMGCGIGACLVCACKTQEADGSWHYRKACKDGPVFDAEEVTLDE